MKKLLSIISIFLCCACEKSWYHEYIISNDTNVEVTIYAYDTDVEPVFNSDVININAKSQYSVLKGNGIDMDYQGVFTIGEVDSVVINFNNEKSLIQSCAFEYGDGCNFDRNIMNFRNEQDFIKRNRGKASGQQQYSFTYTITQEDYNNAVQNVLNKTYIDLGPLEILEPLYESFAISIYKNKLRDTYLNSSESYIDELFSNYY